MEEVAAPFLDDEVLRGLYGFLKIEKNPAKIKKKSLEEKSLEEKSLEEKSLEEKSLVNMSTENNIYIF